MFRFILFLSIVVVRSLQADAFPLVDPTPIHEAFVSKFADIVPVLTIPTPPPAPLVSQAPPKPYNEAIWIPGYWAWAQEKNRYVWVCGVWRIPPLDHMWISGYWMQVEGGYAWMSGFWSPIPLNQLVYIPQLPPNSGKEEVPPAPSEDYFWASGHWEYEAGKYSWLEGQWLEFDPNWVLAPAHYIWRPEGLIFIPTYWDLPIDQRGAAYSCLEPSITIIEPQVIVRRLLIYYPDYIPQYWHWWHFHPGWGVDCDCLPPWWHWHGWWTLDWHDQWNLWWWWGHPGFPSPHWLSLELSSQIAPPTAIVINFFKIAPTPLFITPKGIPSSHQWHEILGKKPFIPIGKVGQIKGEVDKKLPARGDLHRPKGSKTDLSLPRPKIPDTIKGKGKDKFPLPPSGKPRPGSVKSPDLKPGFPDNRTQDRWPVKPSDKQPPQDRKPRLPPQEGKGTLVPPKPSGKEGKIPPQDRRPVLPPQEGKGTLVPPKPSGKEGKIPPQDRRPVLPPQEGKGTLVPPKPSGKEGKMPSQEGKGTFVPKPESKRGTQPINLPERARPAPPQPIQTQPQTISQPVKEQRQTLKVERPIESKQAAAPPQPQTVPIERKEMTLPPQGPALDAAPARGREQKKDKDD